MNKELEAFYKVKDKLIKVEGKTTYGSILDLTNLDIIEAALKDYEELDLRVKENNLLIDTFQKVIKKQEQVLEIIKTRIKLGGLNEDTSKAWYPYIECDGLKNPLTKEEYDLLKEYFK